MNFLTLNLQGPRNSGFNGFIWTHGFLETFESNLLLFTEKEFRGQISFHV